MKLAFVLVFFVGASPFWTLMIFAPKWWWTKRIVSSPWIVAPTLVFWFAFAIPRLGELLPAVAKPTLAGWQDLVTDPAVLTFFWAQIIAWDLFVGRWMYRDGLARGMRPAVMSPLVLLTIMLSPISVPLYLVLRKVLGREPHEELVLPANPGPKLAPEPVRSGWHRQLVWFAAFAAVVEVVSLIGLVFDDRILVGAPIWAKPAKFALSFGLYALMLAWMLTLPRRRLRQGVIIGNITAIVCFIELAIVVLQTVRGHRSHFNIATAFDLMMWAIMAASIGVLFAANVVGAVMLMRERHADRPALWALRLGSVISVAGMAVAFLMVTSSAEQRAQRPRMLIGAHSVGVPDGGQGMAVTGWNTTGGDLRVPHFVGIHGLQLVPLFALGLGLLMTRVPRLRDELVRLRLVWTFASAYLGLLALATWQALRGQALLKPDALTIGALGVLVAGTVVAVVWALRTSKKPVPPPAPPVREEALV
ncbi:ABA4-like family protein [Actinophytocola sp.]|uniref:ABA4-like family protein n=1 Tax=Actinophytocola sp. TaxID=1872138 RepID=UPI002EDA9716